MNSINKFKPLAIEVYRKLNQAGIKCHITHYSRFNNTVYISLRSLDSRYWCIRVSDHSGKLESRYELRTDIPKSFKKDKHLIYAIQDLNGLLMRIKKENAEGHYANVL